MVVEPSSALIRDCVDQFGLGEGWGGGLGAGVAGDAE